MKATEILICENYKQLSVDERKNVLINNIVNLLLLEQSKANEKRQEG